MKTDVYSNENNVKVQETELNTSRNVNKKE